MKFWLRDKFVPEHLECGNVAGPVHREEEQSGGALADEVVVEVWRDLVWHLQVERHLLLRDDRTLQLGQLVRATVRSVCCRTVQILQFRQLNNSNLENTNGIHFFVKFGQLYFPLLLHC